ncbi:hypothetical protein BZK31_04060 [Pseudomonas floridensis]|uniref:Uncharacterized protein n=1 Tax=Pseudomonas floridensis TaxID=1958950 RepID=A0A1X0NB67_9PSED|nr:hypothetical protein [Pseudomonas floridensis]ORC61143.1 hypothetical protein BZK31_04060 [Pseudomonas floridensis]
MSFNSVNHVRRGFMLCLLVGTLSGCAGSNDLLGSLNDSLNGGAKKYELNYLKQNLIPGKTTKEQVRQLFGEPYSESLDVVSGSNDSNWEYRKSEEGLSKYTDLAHKYVSTETSLKMYSLSAQTSRGQDVLSDAANVAGVRKGASKVQGSTLYIYFKNDVIDYYRLQ